MKLIKALLVAAIAASTLALASPAQACDPDTSGVCRAVDEVCWTLYDNSAVFRKVSQGCLNWTY